ETIADQVNSAVCRPTRHRSLRAWPAFFIFKSKWKFQLQFPVLLKMRQRDRQQGYGPLVGVIGERDTNSGSIIVDPSDLPGLSDNVRVMFSQVKGVTLADLEF